MKQKIIIPVYTEKESFVDNKFSDFYISSYKDKEPESLRRIEAHRHTYFEIIWVQKGKGIHTIDFVHYKFKGPCLFLLNPQNIHTIQKDCTTSGGVVKFTSSFFASDAGEENFILKYGVFDDIDVLPVINLKREETAPIQKLFDEMNNEYKKEGSFSEAILLSYLKIFLLKIYEIKKRTVSVSSFKDPEFIRFRNFQQQLDENYIQHHEVSFYASALNISSKTLGNIIQKFTGKSPQQLIKERILLEAKRLLYHSGLSIKEIAYSIGFDDSSYFTRFFKKNTNTSPASYRNKDL